MHHYLYIEGLTCMGCVDNVRDSLSKVDGLQIEKLDLTTGRFEFQMSSEIDLRDVIKCIPDKYQVLTQKNWRDKHGVVKSIDSLTAKKNLSKWRQLFPLFLVLGFLFVVNGLNSLAHDFSYREFMLDFMAGFFLVFSFFKFLDLRGFVIIFRGYDPVARLLELYGWAYPFIELILGLMLLTNVAIDIALYSTLMILGLTTLGVASELLRSNKITCACLGSALNLPMTEATLIENVIMIVMASILILG